MSSHNTQSSVTAFSQSCALSIHVFPLPHNGVTDIHCGEVKEVRGSVDFVVELLRVGQVQVIPHPRGVPDSWSGGGEWVSECAVMRKKIRRILTKLRGGGGGVQQSCRWRSDKMDVGGEFSEHFRRPHRQTDSPMKL